MPHFPVDAPRDRVLKAFAALGFVLVREGNHLALARQNEDGSKTPLTLHDLPTAQHTLPPIGTNAEGIRHTALT